MSGSFVKFVSLDEVATKRRRLERQKLANRVTVSMHRVEDAVLEMQRVLARIASFESQRRPTNDRDL